MKEEEEEEKKKELMKKEQSHVLTHGFALPFTCRNVRWLLLIVYVDRFHVLAVLSPAWHVTTLSHSFTCHLWERQEEEEEEEEKEELY